jgi:hypothetical protein
MRRLPSLQVRINNWIQMESQKVFVRKDFESFGKSSSAIGKALYNLVKQGSLIKAGRGIYVKTKISSLTGRIIPAVSLTETALTALAKFGIIATLGQSAQAYMSGKSTQLPMAVVINVGRSQISRRIGFGGKIVRYENNPK